MKVKIYELEGTSVDAFQNNRKTNLRIKKKERNLKR